METGNKKIWTKIGSFTTISDRPWVPPDGNISDDDSGLPTNDFDCDTNSTTQYRLPAFLEECLGL